MRVRWADGEPARADLRAVEVRPRGQTHDPIARTAIPARSWRAGEGARAAGGGGGVRGRDMMTLGTPVGTVGGLLGGDRKCQV
jgi:hypothetical protein